MTTKKGHRDQALSKELYFLPLGGAGEIGMNLNLYGYEEKWLMVDFGVTFSQDLGIEVILPDPQFIVERQKDLLGILLTHGHEDHIGALPYLWKYLKVPLYATPFTAALIRRKLKDVGLEKEVKIIEIPLCGKTQIGPFKIQLITLTHSIPEPNAIVIETPVGRILHTGDWKIDPSPLVGEVSDEKALRELGDQGVLAMICDSTNVFEQGVSGSEEDVRKGLLDVMKDRTGVVVVSCFSSNVARLETILTVSRNIDRKVCLLGRSMFRFIEVAQECGYLKGFPELVSGGGYNKKSKIDKGKGGDSFFLTPKEASLLPRDQVVVLSTGSQGEARAALSKLAWNQHPDFSLEEGDTVIFSSRVIPGNEKTIGAMQNALVMRGCDVIVKHPTGENPIHVSGHPAQEELKEMYRWVRPKFAIPVHGEARHLKEHERLAEACGVQEVVIPSNGSLIRLTPDSAKIVDHVPAGRLGLDGTLFVSMGSNLLKERRKMASQGTAVVTLVLDRYNELLEDPKWSLFGVVDEEETPERSKRLDKEIERSILRTYNGLAEAMREEDQPIIEGVRTALRQATHSISGKRPLTDVHVVRVL